MTSKGSGLIMSAVVGGAVIPWLIGEVADKVGKHYAIIHSFQYVPGGLADKIGIQTSFIIPSSATSTSPSTASSATSQRAR